MLLVHHTQSSHSRSGEGALGASTAEAVYLVISRSSWSLPTTPCHSEWNRNPRSGLTQCDTACPSSPMSRPSWLGSLPSNAPGFLAALQTRQPCSCQGSLYLPFSLTVTSGDLSPRLIPSAQMTSHQRGHPIIWNGLDIPAFMRVSGTSLASVNMD